MNSDKTLQGHSVVMSCRHVVMSIKIWLTKFHLGLIKYFVSDSTTKVFKVNSLSYSLEIDKKLYNLETTILCCVLST